jgi:hypothetical protein
VVTAATVATVAPVIATAVLSDSASLIRPVAIAVTLTDA